MVKTSGNGKLEVQDIKKILWLIFNYFLVSCQYMQGLDKISHPL